MLHLADGGLQNIVDELRELKSLAINSANDHNTDIDRAIIQKEISQYYEEINDYDEKVDSFSEGSADESVEELDEFTRVWGVGRQPFYGEEDERIHKLKKITSKHISDSEFDKAMKYLNELVAIDPFDLSNWETKGYCHYELGQYDDGNIQVKGHVTSGLSGEDMRRIRSVAQRPGQPDGIPDQSGVVWIDPVLVCTVKYMELTRTGAMRQPVFKGFRDDKLPTDCVAQRC